jgi:hypothetical protein
MTDECRNVRSMKVCVFGDIEFGVEEEERITRTCDTYKTCITQPLLTAYNSPWQPTVHVGTRRVPRL